jgi:hypothetical protein
LNPWLCGLDKCELDLIETVRQLRRAVWLAHGRTLDIHNWDGVGPDALSQFATGNGFARHALESLRRGDLKEVRRAVREATMPV